MPNPPVPQPAAKRTRTAAAQPNPAAVERRKLREALAATHQALEVQATRLEEQANALRSLGALVVAEREGRARDRRATQTVINRQAMVIQGLNARHETTERQITVVAAATDATDEIIRLGREGYRKVAAIYHQANPANPAQPVMEPAAEAPVVTEQESMMPDGMDDVTMMGVSPVSDVSPDAVAAVDEPYGMTAVTPEGLTRIDVTAPVAGTERPNPPEQVITPVDVRVGDPDNPTPAFPWMMGPVGAPQQHFMGPNVGSPMGAPMMNDSAGMLPEMGAPGRMGSQRVASQRVTAASVGSKRPYATMRLAKLRIEAGLDKGDEITVAASLDASGMSDTSIAEQIDTLSKVAAVANKQPASEPGVQHLVPRLARGVPQVRSVPSMATAVNAEQRRVASKHSIGSITEDELGFA